MSEPPRSGVSGKVRNRRNLAIGARVGEGPESTLLRRSSRSP